MSSSALPPNSAIPDANAAGATAATPAAPPGGPAASASTLHPKKRRFDRGVSPQGPPADDDDARSAGLGPSADLGQSSGQSSNPFGSAAPAGTPRGAAAPHGAAPRGATAAAPTDASEAAFAARAFSGVCGDRAAAARGPQSAVGPTGGTDYPSLESGEPAHQSCSIFYDSDDEALADAEQSLRSAKTRRPVASIIHSVAEPRKPRIGPRYQAVVPDFPEAAYPGVDPHSGGAAQPKQQ
mmetsp:Transcript_5489/g.16685  ORF Transcript_5489/g.16685 Transcript_5489/m.16685 type:complete len:239 (+) Transcript_5489:72-788(+)